MNDFTHPNIPLNMNTALKFKCFSYSAITWWFFIHCTQWTFCVPEIHSQNNHFYCKLFPHLWTSVEIFRVFWKKYCKRTVLLIPLSVRFLNCFLYLCFLLLLNLLFCCPSPFFVSHIKRTKEVLMFLKHQQLIHQNGLIWKFNQF